MQLFALDMTLCAPSPRIWIQMRSRIIDASSIIYGALVESLCCRCTTTLRKFRGYPWMIIVLHMYPPFLLSTSTL